MNQRVLVVSGRQLERSRAPRWQPCWTTPCAEAAAGQRQVPGVLCTLLYEKNAKSRRNSHVRAESRPPARQAHASAACPRQRGWCHYFRGKYCLHPRQTCHEHSAQHTGRRSHRRNSLNSRCCCYSHCVQAMSRASCARSLCRSQLRRPVAGVDELDLARDCVCLRVCNSGLGPPARRPTPAGCRALDSDFLSSSVGQGSLM
jgi:hypothetical protein